MMLAQARVRQCPLAGAVDTAPPWTSGSGNWQPVLMLGQDDPHEPRLVQHPTSRTRLRLELRRSPRPFHVGDLRGGVPFAESDEANT